MNPQFSSQLRKKSTSNELWDVEKKLLGACIKSGAICYKGELCKTKKGII